MHCALPVAGEPAAGFCFQASPRLHRNKNKKNLDRGIDFDEVDCIIYLSA